MDGANDWDRNGIYSHDETFLSDRPVYLSSNGERRFWFYDRFWMVSPATNIAEEKFTYGVIMSWSESEESFDCPDHAIQWKETAVGSDWRINNNIDIKCDGKKK